MLEDMQAMTINSLLLSLLLDIVVGSERTVRARRDFIRVTDYAISFRGIPRFISGSRAEGFDMKGSDTDAMMSVPGIVVSSGNLQYCSSTDHVLLMRCEGIHPGFTLLEVVRIGLMSSEVFLSWIENVAFNINYLSSEKFTDYCLLLNGSTRGLNSRIHGPCVSSISTLSGDEHDVGICLVCSTWSLQANAWITRHRSSGFPSQDFIQTLKTLPCYLMAIGSKLSPISSLEWRLSFSVQEKEIIWNMNHTQFKVYGLLKILLKEVLNVRLPDVLCSYYMKTALFWLAEEIPRHCWQDRNFILCFMACLQRITEWAHAGYCPNYFIPENNMFDGKMDETVRKSATRVLCQVMSEGWGIVFRCESLSHFTHYWHSNHANPEHTLSEILQMDKGWMESESDIYTFQSLDQFNSVDKSVIMYLDMLQSIEEDLSDMDPGYIRCIIALLHSSLGTMYFAMSNADGMSNRERYPLLRQARHHFSEGVKSDISNGRLNFATFHYVNGEYSKALALVNSFLSDYGPYVVHVYRVYGSTRAKITEKGISCYIDLFCSNGLGIDRKKQQAVMEDVRFMPFEYNYLPSPVQYELKTMSPFTNQKAFINPVVYAYYLSFRCFEETKRRAESQRALRSLEELLDNDEGIPAEQIHQVYNFAAHCHVVLGDHVTARRLLHTSLDIKTYLNAASLMLNEL